MCIKKSINHYFYKRVFEKTDNNSAKKSNPLGRWETAALRYPEVMSKLNTILPMMILTQQHQQRLHHIHQHSFLRITLIQEPIIMIMMPRVRCKTGCKTGDGSVSFSS